MRKSAYLAAALSTAAMPAFAADVVIGVPNWPSVAMTANVMKVVIEENFGLEVELQNGANPVIFEAMDKGSMHVHPEVWLPNQSNLNNTFVNEKKTVIEAEYGVPAFQGVCVPKFAAEEMGFVSIEDLTDPAKAALLDSDGDGKGEIWIGAPGWASTNVEKIRAKSYGYDETLELVEMDETLALAALDKAVAQKMPYAFFCYTPHHMFSLHELAVLEEPPHDPATWDVKQPTDDPNWLENSKAGSAWDTAYLHIHFAKALEESHPEVAALLSNMQFSTDTLSIFTYEKVVNKVDDATFATDWVSANEDEVLSWLQ